MTTKGIIERVTQQTCNNSTGAATEVYYVYKVRLPIFHGISSRSDCVPTDSLPDAYYPTMPHMQQTKLTVGDVVYVELVDYDLQNVIILGLMPTSTDYQGSAQTASEVALQNVQSMTFDNNGTLRLPSVTNIVDTSGSEIVSSSSLKCLSGATDNIQSKLNDLDSQFKIKIITSDEFSSIQNNTAVAADNTIYFVYNIG